MGHGDTDMDACTARQRDIYIDTNRHMDTDT